MGQKNIDRKIADNTEGKRLEIPSIGVGTMRTSATWISVMLLSEDNPEEILASVMRELNINPQNVVNQYHDTACNKCGISLLAHRKNGMKCF